jgi:hypothetical protein
MGVNKDTAPAPPLSVFHDPDTVASEERNKVPASIQFSHCAAVAAVHQPENSPGALQYQRSRYFGEFTVEANHNPDPSESGIEKTEFTTR